VTILSLGFSITDKRVIEGIQNIKEAYEVIRSREDREFNAYITEPFLTSEEQDKLIEQLREAMFFEHFTHDSQRGGWACKNCLPPVISMPKSTDTSVEAKKVASVDIWQAASAGDLDRVKYLLEFGIDVNARYFIYTSYD
jgi:hypothetical protein